MKFTDYQIMLRRLSQKDCGSSSCQFRGKNKGGQRVNGGCSCVDDVARMLSEREKEMLDLIEDALNTPKASLERQVIKALKTIHRMRGE